MGKAVQPIEVAPEGAGVVPGWTEGQIHQQPPHREGMLEAATAEARRNDNLRMLRVAVNHKVPIGRFGIQTGFHCHGRCPHADKVLAHDGAQLGQERVIHRARRIRVGGQRGLFQRDLDRAGALVDGKTVDVGGIGQDKQREAAAGIGRRVMHREVGDLLARHTQRDGEGQQGVEEARGPRSGADQRATSVDRLACGQRHCHAVAVRCHRGDGRLLAQGRAVAHGLGRHHRYAARRVEDARMGLLHAVPVVRQAKLRIVATQVGCVEDALGKAQCGVNGARSLQPRLTRSTQIQPAGHSQQIGAALLLQLPPQVKSGRHLVGIGARVVGIADDAAAAVAAAVRVAEGELLQQQHAPTSARGMIGGGTADAACSHNHDIISRAHRLGHLPVRCAAKASNKSKIRCMRYLRCTQMVVFT